MEIINNILTEETLLRVIAGLIVSVITYVLAVILKLRLPNPARIIFWNTYIKSLLIIPSELSIEHDPIERLGKSFSLIPTAEVVAISSIISFIDYNFNESPDIKSIQSHTDFDSLKENNLLIVGGPKYNFASNQILKEIDSKLYYQFKRIREPTPVTIQDIDFKVFLNSSNQESYNLTSNSNRQYGTIILTQNPYNPKRKILIIAGLHQLSTLGAAKMISKFNRWIFLKSLIGKNGFQAIISCQDNDHTKVRNINIEFIKKLKL